MKCKIIFLLNSTEHDRAWPRYYHNVYDNRNFLGMCAHVSYIILSALANIIVSTYGPVFCVGGDSEHRS